MVVYYSLNVVLQLVPQITKKSPELFAAELSGLLIVMGVDIATEFVLEFMRKRKDRLQNEATCSIVHQLSPDNEMITRELQI